MVIPSHFCLAHQQIIGWKQAVSIIHWVIKVKPQTHFLCRMMHAKAIIFSLFPTGQSKADLDGAIKSVIYRHPGKGLDLFSFLVNSCNYWYESELNSNHEYKENWKSVNLDIVFARFTFQENFEWVKSESFLLCAVLVVEIKINTNTFNKKNKTK